MTAAKEELFNQQLRELESPKHEESRRNFPLELFRRTGRGIFAVEYLRQNQGTGKPIDVEVYDWLMNGLSAYPHEIGKELGLCGGSRSALTLYELESRNRQLAAIVTVLKHLNIARGLSAELLVHTGVSGIIGTGEQIRTATIATVDDIVSCSKKFKVRLPVKNPLAAAAVIKWLIPDLKFPVGKPDSRGPWKDLVAWKVARYLTKEYGKKIARNFFKDSVFEEIPYWKKKYSNSLVVFLLIQSFAGGRDALMASLWADHFEKLGTEIPS